MEPRRYLVQGLGHCSMCHTRINALRNSSAGLTDVDRLDLAAYYAYLPHLPPDLPTSADPAPAIVISGAPMRNIAPCGACHGGPDKPPCATAKALLQSQVAAFPTE